MSSSLQETNWKWNPEEEHPCTIPQFTLEQLHATFGPRGVPAYHPWPLIVRRSSNANDARNQDVRSMVETPQQLWSQFEANFTITLSSSNSFSEYRRTITLRQYLEDIGAWNHTGVTLPTAKANESWYLFGETYGQEWKQQLLQYYTLPPCVTCEPDYTALSFGVGNRGSGVQWHLHGPGFSEALQGRKHWVLYPKNYPVPHFHPDQTSRHWMETVYTNTTLLVEWQQHQQQTRTPPIVDIPKFHNHPQHGRPYECTLTPGDLVYFPDQWYHATINCDPYTAFVSSFTADHLYVKDHAILQGEDSDDPQHQQYDVTELWPTTPKEQRAKSPRSTFSGGDDEL